MQYLYIIEKANDGSYSAYVPDLPGCTSCGDTVAEVKAGIKDAVDLGTIWQYGVITDYGRDNMGSSLIMARRNQ